MVSSYKSNMLLIQFLKRLPRPLVMSVKANLNCEPVHKAELKIISNHNGDR